MEQATNPENKEALFSLSSLVCDIFSQVDTASPASTHTGNPTVSASDLLLINHTIGIKSEKINCSGPVEDSSSDNLTFSIPQLVSEKSYNRKDNFSLIDVNKIKTEPKDEFMTSCQSLSSDLKLDEIQDNSQCAVETTSELSTDTQDSISQCAVETTSELSTDTQDSISQCAVDTTSELSTDTQDNSQCAVETTSALSTDTQYNIIQYAHETTSELSTNIVENQCIICIKCNNWFSCEQDLKAHNETAHRKHGHYKCDHCDKGFTLKSSLTRHSKRLHTYKTVQKNKSKAKKCPHCNVMFPENIFDLHVQSHSLVKKFNCKHCNQAFVFEKCLKKHQLLHNKERKTPNQNSENLQCPQCKKIYLDKWTLRRHLRTHAKQTEKTTEKNSSQLPQIQQGKEQVEQKLPSSQLSTNGQSNISQLQQSSQNLICIPNVQKNVNLQIGRQQSMQGQDQSMLTNQSAETNPQQILVHIPQKQPSNCSSTEQITMNLTAKQIQTASTTQSAQVICGQNQSKSNHSLTANNINPQPTSEDQPIESDTTSNGKLLPSYLEDMKVFLCKECNLWFHTISNVQVHNQEQHPGEKTFIQRMEVSKTGITTLFISSAVNTKDVLLSYDNSQQMVFYLCCQCSFWFNSLKSLEEHNKKEHKPEQYIQKIVLKKAQDLGKMSQLHTESEDTERQRNTNQLQQKVNKYVNEEQPNDVNKEQRQQDEVPQNKQNKSTQNQQDHVNKEPLNEVDKRQQNYVNKRQQKDDNEEQQTNVNDELPQNKQNKNTQQQQDHVNKEPLNEFEKQKQNDVNKRQPKDDNEEQRTNVNDESPQNKQNRNTQQQQDHVNKEPLNEVDKQKQNYVNKRQQKDDNEEQLNNVNDDSPQNKQNKNTQQQQDHVNKEPLNEFDKQKQNDVNKRQQKDDNEEQQTNVNDESPQNKQNKNTQQKQQDHVNKEPLNEVDQQQQNDVNKRQQKDDNEEQHTVVNDEAPQDKQSSVNKQQQNDTNKNQENDVNRQQQNVNKQKRTKKRKYILYVEDIVPACTVCHIWFSTKQQLKDHEEKNHKKEDKADETLNKNVQTQSYFNKTEQYNIEFICALCDICFSSSHELSCHHQAGHEKPFSCLICEERFSHMNMLSSHEKECSYLKCNMCPQIFKNEKDLENHCLSHGPEGVNKTYKCGRCKEAFSSLHLLKCHLSLYDNPSCELRCHLCEKKFVSVLKLNKHLTIIHKEGLLSCDICCQSFVFLAQFKKHKQEAHPEGKSIAPFAQKRKYLYIRRDEKPRCLLCHKVFHQLGLLEGHSIVHIKNRPGRPTCNVCGMQFFRIKSLEIHQISHTNDKRFKCHICGEGFNYKETCQSHIHKEHIGKPKCKICGKEFLQLSYLKFHELTHTDEKPIKCEICGKGFCHIRLLNEHKRRHVVREPSKCEICGREFQFSKSLKNHMNTHKEETPYKCTICGQDFTYKTPFESHVAKHSMPDCPPKKKNKVEHVPQTFKCKKCNEKFLDKMSLDSHVSGHTPLTCDICNKELLSLKSLRCHKEIHDKKWACQKCDKKFATKNHLKIHNYKHTESPFKCPECGKGFSCQNNVKKHVLSMHKVGSYPCTLCENTFVTKALLLEHLQAHKRENGYICTICGKRFSEKDSLRCHAKFHRIKRYGCYKCPDKRYFGIDSLKMHVFRMHTKKLTKSVDEKSCFKNQMNTDEVADLVGKESTLTDPQVTGEHKLNCASTAPLKDGLRLGNLERRESPLPINLTDVNMGNEPADLVGKESALTVPQVTVENKLNCASTEPLKDGLLLGNLERQGSPLSINLTDVNMGNKPADLEGKESSLSIPSTDINMEDCPITESIRDKLEKGEPPLSTQPFNESKNKLDMAELLRDELDGLERSHSPLSIPTIDLYMKNFPMMEPLTDELGDVAKNSLLFFPSGDVNVEDHAMTDVRKQGLSSIQSCDVNMEKHDTTESVSDEIADLMRNEGSLSIQARGKTNEKCGDLSSIQSYDVNMEKHVTTESVIDEIADLMRNEGSLSIQARGKTNEKCGDLSSIQPCDVNMEKHDTTESVRDDVEKDVQSSTIQASVESKEKYEAIKVSDVLRLGIRNALVRSRFIETYCYGCKMWFGCKQKLGNHAHFNEKRFKCKHCERPFTHYNAYQMHENTHGLLHI